MKRTSTHKKKDQSCIYGATTQNDPGESRDFLPYVKTILKNFKFLSFLFCFAGLLLCASGHAQIPAQCGSPGCTSNDVRITKATITDEAGGFFNCSGTENVSGAWLHLFVTTNTKRKGVFVSLTVNVVTGTDTARTNIPYCFTNASLNGVDNDLKVLLPDGVFKCGSKVFLSQIYTAWGTGTSDFCGGSTGVVCQGTPSKCRFVAGEVLQVQTTPCSQPTINQSPSGTNKCVGVSATFTAKFIDETAPISTTYKWQICTDGSCATDASWSNLTVTGSPYDSTSTKAGSERTATLTISASGVTTSLNGNQYRVLVSNASIQEPTKAPCTLATSAATLTVTATPTTASAGNPQTICTTATAALAANNPAVGTGAWSVFSGPSTLATQFSSTASNTATFTPAGGAGSYVLRWTVSNSSCSASTSDVTITVNEIPDPPTFCVVQPSLCGPTTGSVTILTPAPAANIEYSIDNGSTWRLSTITNGTIFSNLAPGSVTGIKVKIAGCISTAASCDASQCTNQSITQSSSARMRTDSYSMEQQIIVEEPTKVTAYPNPFSNKVKFVVTSAIVGKGSLEVYNMLGQKIKSVYQGNIIAGNQIFELSLPSAQRSNLIYVLRVGDKRVTGKLLHLNR
jgi:hypothetical protein